MNPSNSGGRGKAASNGAEDWLRPLHPAYGPLTARLRTEVPAAWRIYGFSMSRPDIAEKKTLLPFGVQTTRHKFIVMDFNDFEPVVFTSSSNLAAGGEKANGDNLLAIFDRAVATAYAVEAVRLVDHYHFRASMKRATSDKPLMLKTDDGKIKWWSRHYNQDNPKFRERKLFIS